MGGALERGDYVLQDVWGERALSYGRGHGPAPVFTIPPHGVVFLRYETTPAVAASDLPRPGREEG